MTKKHAYRIQFTSKNNKEHFTIGKLWPNDRNDSLSLSLEGPYQNRPGVKLIEVTLTDGTVLTSEGCFIDAWPNTR